jgi:hypothetical protein
MEEGIEVVAEAGTEQGALAASVPIVKKGGKYADRIGT